MNKQTRTTRKRGQSGRKAQRRRRQARDAVQWQRLINQQRTSGQSVRAFCRQHDLGEASFYAWRSRLRSEASADPGHAAFVRLEPKPADSPPARTVEVHFPSGASLHCPAEHLSELVRLLQGEDG